MVNSKQIYSKYFPEYEVSPEKNKELQKVELSMLKDIKECCAKHNLKYMLCGGTLLGAIRHDGFIPWDDDIDIMMFRDDYEKLENCMNVEYGDKYVIKTPENDKKYLNKMMKIFLNNTELVEIEAENFPGDKKVFIDVFPIEYAPESKLARKMRGALYNLAYLATGSIYDYKYPSQTIINKAKKEIEVKKYYNKKRFAGSIFNIFFGFQFWKKITMRLAKHKESSIVCIPSGIRYNREVFSAQLLRDLIEKDFEGESFSIPKNYDDYLKNLYRNYMEIPPVEKREKHMAIKLVL